MFSLYTVYNFVLRTQTLALVIAKLKEVNIKISGLAVFISYSFNLFTVLPIVILLYFNYLRISELELKFLYTLMLIHIIGWSIFRFLSLKNQFEVNKDVKLPKIFILFILLQIILYLFMLININNYIVNLYSLGIKGFSKFINIKNNLMEILLWPFNTKTIHYEPSLRFRRNSFSSFENKMGESKNKFLNEIGGVFSQIKRSSEMPYSYKYYSNSYRAKPLTQIPRWGFLIHEWEKRYSEHYSFIIDMSTIIKISDNSYQLIRAQ